MRIKMVMAGVLAVAACGVVVGAQGPAPAAESRFETSAGPVLVERVTGDLDRPWAVAFLPTGGVLVTEVDGRLLHIGDRGRGARTDVAGLPAIEAIGQGGLLDVVAARDFADSREIFLTYSAPDGRATRTTLARARLSTGNDRLEELSVIWEQDPPVASSRHFGSRVVEAEDGTLWVTIGDRADRPRAQDPQQMIGKVIRVARDGSVPADNPFADGQAARAPIWSIGHRNPQGAAMDPETGALWTVEHGARGGDEINRPEAGKNYGWPQISYGTHYSGFSFPGSSAPGLEQPVFYWDPSIAPSGMTIYSGRLFPEWAGDIFVGALKSQLISRLDRAGAGSPEIAGEERLFEREFGRIRDVREGPDGALWFLTDDDPGGLYRVTPG